jgi:hypothetical protein
LAPAWARGRPWRCSWPVRPYRFQHVVIGSIMGVKKTVTFCGIIVIMSTIAGMVYGWVAE